MCLLGFAAFGQNEATFYAFEWTLKNVTCQDANLGVHIYVNCGGNPVNEWNGNVFVKAHSSVIYSFGKVILGYSPLGHFEVVDGATGGDGVLTVQYGNPCDGDTSATNKVYSARVTYQICGVFARRKSGESGLVRLYRREIVAYHKIQ
jgi:hypothetical protein